MSEEDTPTPSSLPAADSSKSSDKPAPKRAPRKAAKKAVRKVETADQKQKEVSNDSNDSRTNERSKVSNPKDDTFDPGNEVSFSFDPNEVAEPKTSNSQGSPESSNEPRQESNNNNNQGRHQHNRQNPRNDGQRGKFKKKQPKHNHPNHPNHQNQQKKHAKKRPQHQKKRRVADSLTLPVIGTLLEDEVIANMAGLKLRAAENVSGGDPIKLNDFYQIPLLELVQAVEALGVELTTAPNRRMLIELLIKKACELKRQILDTGLLWVTEEEGAFIVHEHNNYVPQPQDFFVPNCFIKQFGLKSGHMVDVQVLPQEGEGCGYVVDIFTASGLKPEEIQHVTPFEDLIPYYPTERIILETPVGDIKKQDVSMRVVDALTPIGFGQRGLIVAPPRTGKTIILQGLANSLAANNPESDLIVLLIDERPEEVTDFRRMVKGEVIASTFDEAAENHVHVAEMVIEKARRMVEVGRHVIILLDSITRLARGYNTTMPNSGKILSGGVEAGALQKPKRFFGSARNIEGGGSLTIMGTALVETGSKMDEVVYEEFKGTGNMELQLDRTLSDKRIFPAINLEKSGTRKEELLYHKDELPRIYALRRAMKGIPATEAMEMLINRMKKTATNVEFLMQVNR
ncbi:MAG: transcription termination factor Rho [Verrucomicrobia bacterium]|nr:transcription termination factor Rho [Verrucomicrobiota bacterium]